MPKGAKATPARPQSEVVRCEKCGAELQIGDWPFCDKTFGHDRVRRQDASHFQPIVIHKDKHGNIRYPGHANARVPRGFERVELTNAAEVRRFERDVNRREKAEASRVREGAEAAFAEERKERRAELRGQMQHMTQFGRDFANAALEAGDRREREFDPGFHVDVLSNDSSNREAYADQESGWKSRKA